MALLPVLALPTHVLCAMATGNTMATTSPRGMWTVNKLYNSLPHTPNLMQKDGAPQTPKAMVTEKEEDDKTPLVQDHRVPAEEYPILEEAIAMYSITHFAQDAVFITQNRYSAGCVFNHEAWTGFALPVSTMRHSITTFQTRRYTTNAFRCTVPLPGHLAIILRTLTFYDLHYQMKVSDWGPYGLHFDFIMNLNDVANLVDLFSTESALQFQQQVWDYKESIYESLKTEVYGLPQVQYDCRDLWPTFYAFFARVSNQLDWPNDGSELQRISVLERR